MFVRRHGVAAMAGAISVVCSALTRAQSVNFNVPLYSAIDKPSRPFFRAPSLQVAADGSLLAFCEARQTIDDPGRGSGLIDIVMKKSVDGGQTWSPLRTLYANSTNDYVGANPVLDRTNNTVFLHFEETPNLFLNNGQVVSTGYGSNTFHHYVMQSGDNAQTWSAPQVITPQVKAINWDIFGLGPATGLQLKWQTNPARNGRLIIPAARSDVATAANLAVYNDAHGAVAAWQRGAEATSAQTTEVDLVELTNGNLLMNARADNGGPRQQYLSSDGGQTWGAAQAVDVPVTPIDSSLIRYSAKRDGGDRDRLLFSAPLGEPMGGSSGSNYNDRYNIGIWTSYDEGKTYINPKQISGGWAGYSALQKLPDGSVGMMYESSFSYVDADIRYANYSLPFIEGQAHQAQLTHYEGFGNKIVPLRGGVGWSGGWSGTATVVPTGQLTYSGFKFPTEQGRADLLNGQSIQRKLATDIDLNSNSTTYLSLLISNQYDTSPNTGNDFFSLELQNAAGAAEATIGVSSTEQFLVSGLGSSASTAAGSLTRNGTYFLVAKIVSQDSQSGGNVDRIFLKVFQSGFDAIPADDGQVGWTLAGGTDENSAALIDRIAMFSGTEVKWSIDELRIGTTFSSVASNAVATVSTWALNGSGDWNAAANWTGGVPNAAGSTVLLGGIITLPQTIYTNAAVTVGTLRFDNSSSYMVTGQGSLTLAVTSGAALVDVVRGSHKINLPLFFASDTTVTVASGATLTLANPVTIRANKTVTAAGVLQVQAPLKLEAGASLVLNGPMFTLLGAPTVGAGAEVDAKRTTLSIDYRETGPVADTIKSQLISGYNNGAWNGEGINTSAATAATGLGWKDDADNQRILVKYTYYGDANLDGQVNITDLAALATGWQTSGVWVNGDFNYNGFIDITDLAALATNWQAGAGNPLGPSLDQALESVGLSGSTVPEPALGAPLAMGLLPLRRRTSIAARRCKRQPYSPRTA